MCRWLAYVGTPIHLEELIFEATHSLAAQSRSARLGEMPTNGDGFGVGWYGSRDEPGVFRDIQPAWGDRNLREIAAQIESPMFLAHIRATTGTAVQQTNCHPFRHGRWLFMHNGVVRGLSRLRRELAFAVDPSLYPHIEGTTDTELLFYLALTFGLDDDPQAGIARMAGFVERRARAANIDDPLTMTLGISDGERLYAVRYSSERASRSLFYNEDERALRALKPNATSFGPQARAIVSEPLSSLEGWKGVDEATWLVVEGGEVHARPFAPAEPAR